MSQETNRMNDVETNSGGNSGVSQPPAEVVAEHIQIENRLVATAGDAEKPNPEPPGEGAVFPEETKSLIAKDLEERAAAGEDDTTSSARRVSDRKLAANRENAKHSPGPTTAEGKATSSRNSYKHGFFSNNLIRPGEQEEGHRAGFEMRLEAIAGYYQPVGFMEKLLVEKIAVETVRFSRLLVYEQQEFKYINAFRGSGVDRILRYQATINRQLFQAMEKLELLQAKRKDQSSSPEHAGCEPKGGVSEPTTTDAHPSATSEKHPSHEEGGRQAQGVSQDLSGIGQELG
jgi:hypothetical protein